MRKQQPENECFLCDSVMAVLGGLIGILLIGIAVDLLSKGAITGRIVAATGGGEMAVTGDE